MGYINKRTGLALFNLPIRQHREKIIEEFAREAA